MPGMGMGMPGLGLGLYGGLGMGGMPGMGMGMPGPALVFMVVLEWAACLEWAWECQAKPWSLWWSWNGRHA